jgi:molybdopterin molybdotransferase
MSQLSDDCFAFGGPLMTTAEALRLLTDRVEVQVEVEEIGLEQAAGRILARPLVSDLDVPPYDNAAVDGYAMRHRDLDPVAETRLAVVGRAAAGHPHATEIGAGEAVRIFTGAMMAPGSDTVVMQEDVRPDGSDVLVPPGLSRGANRRAAGEDVQAGRTVLRAGRRLRAQEVGLAATVGQARLQVYRPLRVAVFSTGDELREPGTALPPGAIYDANRYLLRALLEGLHCRVGDLGILADDAAQVAEQLAAAAGEHDLLVTSGGVSTGEEDHVKAAVEANGSLYFWRLAIKPGRPLALGQVAGTPFVGLPGNPVAAMICFLRFARPLILKLAGAVDFEPVFFQVRADFEHHKKPARREWLRAKLVPDGQGGLVARKFERQGSGIITSLVEADGLVEIPEDVTYLAKGQMVDFLPFNEVTS